MAESDWGRITGRPWGMLAIDLDRAYVRAGMTEYEAMLMQYMRERYWVKARMNKLEKAVPIVWEAGKIADELGAHRTRISEARTSLVGSKMLMDTPHGLTINKNAHQWIYPPAHKRAGEPRLSVAALAYAIAGRTIGGFSGDPETPDPTDQNVSGSTDNPSANPDNDQQTLVRQTGQECPPIRTEVSGIPDKSVRQSGQNCPPNRTSLYTERAREELEKDRKEEKREGRESDATNLSLKDFSPKTDNTPPRDPKDEADFDEAIRVLSTNLTTDEHIGYKLNGRRDNPGIRKLEGWKFLVAARKLVGPAYNESHRKGWKYFLSIVDGALKSELEPKKLKIADTYKNVGPEYDANGNYITMQERFGRLPNGDTLLANGTIIPLRQAAGGEVRP